MTAHRARRLAVAAAAMLVAAPVMWPAGAHADETDVITFRGGCALQLLGALGSVDPSQDRVAVASGERVRFVNQLNRDAVLSFDGEAAVELPRDGSAEVVFHEGPVTATMAASCLLGAVSGSATIEVAPQPAPPSREPAGPPREPSQPAPSGPSTAPPGGSGSASGDGSQQSPPASGTPDGNDPVDRSSQPSPGTDPGAGDSSDAPSAPGGSVPTGPPAGGQQVDTAPGDAAMPPWELPSARPSDAAVSGGAADGTGPATDEQGEPGTRAEQMSPTAGTSSGDGPNGMLALIATVCVAGVTAGAIRTVIAQRAARTEWA